MNEAFLRIQMQIGSQGLKKLQNARVAIFGIGGVGGHAMEALARSGIGHLDLIDKDTVSVSNLNRQIIATRETVGMDKVEVAKARILSINPDCEVRTFKTFYLPETAGLFDFSEYDYIVDAIDTVTGKLQLITRAQEVGTPIISCMGTGNKMDPSMLEISDIYKTTVCPLAKVMRKECKKRGIKKLKVVYSRELPMTPVIEDDMAAEAPDPGRRAVPGSNAFVPASAGLLIASAIVRELSGF